MAKTHYYGEPTKGISIKVPESKETEIRAKFDAILLTYRKDYVAPTDENTNSISDLMKPHPTGHSDAFVADNPRLNLQSVDRKEFDDHCCDHCAAHPDQACPTPKVDSIIKTKNKSTKKKPFQDIGTNADFVVPSKAINGKYTQIGKNTNFHKWNDGEVWRVRKWVSGGWSFTYYQTEEEARTAHPELK